MLNEEAFIEFVMNEAKKLGKVFIIDSGEGHDCIDDETGWYMEDFSGWLVSSSDEEELLKARENGTAYKDYSDTYVFAIWSKSEQNILQIEFKKY